MEMEELPGRSPISCFARVSVTPCPDRTPFLSKSPVTKSHTTLLWKRSMNQNDKMLSILVPWNLCWKAIWLANCFRLLRPHGADRNQNDCPRLSQGPGNYRCQAGFT